MDNPESASTTAYQPQAPVDRERAAATLVEIVTKHEDHVAQVMARAVKGAVPRLLSLTEEAVEALVAAGVLVDGRHVETIRAAADQEDWSGIKRALREIEEDRVHVALTASSAQSVEQH